MTSNHAMCRERREPAMHVSFTRKSVARYLASAGTMSVLVYHCHILEHEDGGMMANILVQPRPES